MRFRFTIINNRTSQQTVIDEPVGFDKNKLKISRDLDWHGIFFSNQGDLFQFYGEAEKILKAENDAYRLQADMSLQLEEDCGDGFEILETQKFNFSTYDHVSAANCFVRISLEKNDDVMDIRNRFDQKVNLETLVAFDETTALVPYTRLPFKLMLPSKGIYIQDEFQNETTFSTPVQGVPENNNPGTTPADHNSEVGMIEIGFDKNISSEIGNASSLTQSRYSCVITAAGSLGCGAFDRFIMTGPAAPIEICPLQISPWVNFQEGSPNYGAVDNPCKLEITINGEIEVLAGTVNYVWWVLTVLPFGAVGNVESDYVFIQKNLVYQAPGPGLPPGSIIDISQVYTDNNFTLNEGDRIYSFYTIYHRRQNSSITAGGPGWNMTFNADNFVKLTNISHTANTECKVFAINESISRVVETITNDNVRAYSELYGRTDSEPYSHVSDGCGSLKAITDGLRIRRQENKIPGQTTVYSVSLKDIFEGLNPIDNIGMGIEPDPNRAGFNRLRVEDWSHFYNDTVIMSCTNVASIRRKTNPKEIYSIFNFGFQKWEAEEYNGLDEFLTKRSYRTTLKEVNNTLTKYTAWIGSGYAWEITRRIGNNNSKDWRYDKETFVVCLTRDRKYHVKFFSDGNKMRFETDTDGTEFVGPSTITISGSQFNNGTRTIFVASIIFIPGQATIIEIGFSGGATIDEESYDVTFNIVSPAGLFVELGNVINDVNIIDPRTIYNYRISPIRNAMRWMNKVLQSYQEFDPNAKLIFTDGDGNYFAEGEMESTICKLENGPLAENVTISASIYTNPDDAKPILEPERVVFDYPMTSCEYKAIKANPGGKIYFENECEIGYGYIDEIIYTPREQMANFNLIPVNQSGPFVPPTNNITTEFGIDILTEDGQNIEIE